MKAGKDGIQGELQIGREEKLWILLQAPLEMRCLDFRIPFHSLEEEKEGEYGGEKIMSFEILTLQLCCLEMKLYLCEVFNQV
jgi:hypothetical protein